jgi:hypothetical protein
MSGASEEHDVHDVSFANFEILGTKLDKGSSTFQVGSNVSWTVAPAVGSGSGASTRFSEKEIQQWTRQGALDAPPARVSDLLPFSDQPNRGQWVKFEPMWDEFEAPRLDTNKWNVGMSWWRGRQPAWFNPSNVFVEGGQLHLRMRMEPLSTGGQGRSHRSCWLASLRSLASPDWRDGRKGRKNRHDSVFICGICIQVGLEFS